MANTIMTAKNTFNDGLVMDFAPDNTPATTMTSALNATLVTFNGNEMSLQNDMGNGRVETARLPDGYIPIGTCEFGDIIYVVSYNPIVNKSQIGCFPSPERNISSEEIGNLDILISSSDFQKIENGTPTGELLANSCKKILYEKSLNPGDKYVIYNKAPGSIENSMNTITDVGNTSHIFGEFPKLLKVHVVAIEDSGKINFLDSSVKWYDKHQEDYFIQNIKNNRVTGKPDLDSYRSLVSSAYSIFQSKVSGKLALLIELEKINSFSCTYDIYPDKELVEDYYDPTYGSVMAKNYKVFWNINWGTSDNNINPKYLVLTKSDWSGKEEGNYGKWFPYYAHSNSEYRISNSISTNITLPTSFRNQQGQLQTGYWYAVINRSYQPENYGNLTFDNFLTIEGYDAKLQTFLNNVRNTYPAYQDQNLNKLNIDRESQQGLPIFSSDYTTLGNSYNGKYYINLKYRQIPEGSNNYVYYTSLSTGSYTSINAVEVTDDIANNYFKSNIYKYFADFKIPYKQLLDGNELKPDITNLIYHYNIAPAMPYGILEEFTQEGYIDFSKVGSGEINLVGWKYYNTENLSTLNIGLEAYPEANKGISEIVLEFYDNQGKAAAYHISDRSSYSGNFTEYIPLNGVTQNYKLNNIDADNKPIIHAGTLANLQTDTNLVFKVGSRYYKLHRNGENYYYVNDAGNQVTIDAETNSNSIYTDDSGVIYSGILYLVKITIKYCAKDAMGQYVDSDDSSFKYEWRWYWTNTLLNNQYFEYTDFNDIKPALDLDVSAQYLSTPAWKIKQGVYERLPLAETSAENNYVNLSAIVQSINQEQRKEDNVNVKIEIGLQNNYNSLSLAKSVDDVDYLRYFNLNMVLGKSYINQSQESVLNSNSPQFEPFEGLYAQYNSTPSVNIVNNYDTYGYLEDTLSSTLHSIIKSPSTGTEIELWSDSESYKNFVNKYSLSFSQSLGANTNTNTFNYLGNTQVLESINNYLEINTTLDQVYDSNIPLSFSGIHYSKYYKENTQETVYLPTLTPLINTTDQLDTYGLEIINDKPYFKEATTIAEFRSGGGGLDGDDSHFYINKRNFETSTGDFLGSASITKSAEQKNDKARGYALYKNANEGIHLYDNPEYFRDFFPYNINLVLLARRSKNATEWRRDSDKVQIYPRLSSYTGSTVGTRIPPSYDKFEEGDGIFGALVMKDVTGETRIINSVFHLSYDVANKKVSQYLVNDNPTNPGYSSAGNNVKSDITVGQVVTSILSNLFVYEDSPVQVTIPRIGNIAYLDNNISSFTKDIIYTITIQEGTDHLGLILLHGIQLSSYKDAILEHVDRSQINMSNVEITINSIQKNIPVTINFNYIKPSTIINNTGYNTAIRLGESDTYQPIIGTFNKNVLWTVNKQIKDTVYVMAANIVQSKLVKTAQKNDSGFIKYVYDDNITVANYKFSNIFTYTDGVLRLKKEMITPSDIIEWTNASDAGRIYISGISVNEYLDNNSQLTVFSNQFGTPLG